MQSALERARAVARKAQERLYDGRCTVSEWREVKDPHSHITRDEEVVVLENEPCRLSFETIKPTTETDTVAKLAQGVKLILSPDTVIKPGSKITVTQAGRTTEYSASGQPAIYSTHQEIVLELYDEYA